MFAQRPKLLTIAQEDPACSDPVHLLHLYRLTQPPEAPEPMQRLLPMEGGDTPAFHPTSVSWTTTHPDDLTAFLELINSLGGNLSSLPGQARALIAWYGLYLECPSKAQVLKAWSSD